MILIPGHAQDSFFSKYPKWLEAVRSWSPHALPLIPNTSEGNKLLKRFRATRNTSALFLTFTQLHPTKENLAKFWRDYCGVDARLTDVIVSPGQTPAFVFLNPSSREHSRDESVGGASFKSWRSNVFRMRHCIRVWEAIRAHIHGTPAAEGYGLSDLIVWNSTGHGLEVMTRFPDRKRDQFEPILTPLKRPGVVLNPFASRDLLAPATFYIQSVINERVNSENPEGPLRVVSRMIWDSVTPRLVSQQIPLDLLGGMWLQLAEAMAKDSKFVNCPICQTPFVMAPEHTRNDRLYCTETCRTSAYRERKKMAAQLFDQGDKLKTIAKKLQTDVSTVEGWLSSGRVNRLRKT